MGTHDDQSVHARSGTARAEELLGHERHGGRVVHPTVMTVTFLRDRVMERRA